jgi:transketolase
MKEDAMDRLDELCVNTIRMLSVDSVENANSGHPGMPMGAATMAYVLWDRFLRHNPANPDWPDRDRFVLSAGHGSMLLYSLLHLAGYDLSLEDLRNFRQWDSKTPGHPESNVTAGVETTTGPLGQGFANGVGMAIAERYLGARFNRPDCEIVNHYIYGIVSDGDLMEGVSHEAASLAGHLKLGNIIYLYDDNHISIDGSTDLSFTEDRIERFEAYGWHVQKVEDGNDVEAIETAIRAAQEEDVRPSLVSVRTHIGYGSPHKQDTSSAHGEPLGAEEIKLTKENLDWPVEPAFFVPDEVQRHFRQGLERGKALEKEWTDRFEAYEKSHPELALQWKQWMKGELPDGWDKELPSFPTDAKGTATRGVSGTVLNVVAPILPNLIGGSADLAPSNKTFIKGEEVFQGGQFRGRNFHFGVREHGMGSLMNGMALHGGLIPYGGTFLVFADYMRPPIRLAAMMGLKVIYVLTHDSIGLGEDGPTHQPIEHLAALRAIPDLTVLRPCDANETVEAWRFVLEQKDGPVVLALTRQSVPVLDREVFASADGLRRGAYVLSPADEDKDPDVILMGTGSEVHLAIEAARTLEEKGVSARVVSMPSWELFDRQPEAYQSRVLPAAVKARVAVEAGIIQGWHRYLGEKGEFVGLDHFGASAPYKTLYEKFGITTDRIVEKALKLLD